MMLSLSVLDLLPEAVEEIGFVVANISFYIGVAFFATVVRLIPEPDTLLDKQVNSKDKADAVCLAKDTLMQETATQGYGTTAAISATSSTAETKARMLLSRNASPG